MKTKKYIVIAAYNSELAKRQPWYSVSYFIEKLRKDYDCIIVGSVKDIPKTFTGEVIKVFSLKDIITFDSFRSRKYKLTYFCSLPIYNFSSFFCLGLNNLLRNIQDLYRLIIISLIPKSLICNVFSNADSVIFISDETYNLFSTLNNKLHLIPFKKDNWGGGNNIEIKRDKVAYLGPPFETRGFDIALNLFNKIEGYECKVITRIERDSLKKRLINYSNNSSNVKFILGMLSREELLKELSDVKILVLPFRVVMSELPIVVLEAAELGIQIITTKECGVSSIKNFPGVIINKKDIPIDILDKVELKLANQSFFDEVEKINSIFWSKYNGKD
ncbi:hypothetical protein BIT28_19040 [Photobacterium proteolyticum]|uniref:Glycosyl transferase family 1 domain-containing protein n=1 Tax=Photobacterium proteolyticum TaxID=1903952 RepID=A0A1Q9GN98_9GAMM|nr:glycosyltransferase [Photobacterium proteolyticum]OLQ76111.1 hypothetical protein BIT28_19040 [Photobacterium proteolyticum]